MAKKIDVEAMLAAGYARVSGNHLMVSRIDIPHWLEFMAAKHAPWDPIEEGMNWVKSMGLRGAADHYRRCYSKDTQTIYDVTSFKRFPPSGEGPEAFRPLTAGVLPRGIFKRLSGMNVVLSGVTARSRGPLVHALGRHGGTVKGAVSATTDVLVVGTIPVGAKAAVAYRIGVPVISIETLHWALLISEATPAMKFLFKSEALNERG